MSFAGSVNKLAHCLTKSFSSRSSSVRERDGGTDELSLRGAESLTIPECREYSESVARMLEVGTALRV